MPPTLESYVLGRWQAGDGVPTPLFDPTTEEVLAECSTAGIDRRAVLEHARARGGPALREMSFAGRARMLQDLSTRIHEHREALIEVSMRNGGTTRSDAKFDIDGATGTLAAYAQLGKDLGERTFLPEGEGIALGRTPRFWGQHVLVPRHGVGVHVNAFNFPAWNMMEKAACAWLAGVPVVEKPGTPTAMLAWELGKVVVASGILPEGAFQILVGEAGDLLDHMGPQDALAFTGSSTTAFKLRSHPGLLRHGVRVNVEADSLNAAVLAPDVEPDTDTWRLFVKYVALDVRQKTGQKCTAVRRVLVPHERLEPAREALREALERIRPGDPREEGVDMGPVASAAQHRDVRAGIERLGAQGRILSGGSTPPRERGWFVSPTLIEADAQSALFHEEEVFGPVVSLMGYDGDPEHGAAVVARAQGSLVGSLYTDDGGWAERAVLALAPWHGRLWVGSAKVAEHAFPPGTVLPAMIHGGPGRAGGGEELGGLRGLALYLQRTAIQGFKGQVEGAFGQARAAVT